MEAKKNEKLKLEKNSHLYFLIGMTLVLAITYFALEWKSYETNDFIDPSDYGLLEDLETELPPITEQKLPPPPKIEAIPEIEVVDDEKDIIETVIDTDEPDQDTKILTVESVDFEDPIFDESIGFEVVEDVPVFPGCENAEDKKTCFQEQMLKHVKRVFHYPETAINMNLQGRVSVMFTIQKDGSIGDVKMRGPHKILEEEADRIISKLPKMTPGKQRGQPVKVPFSIPITFKLQ